MESSAVLKQNISPENNLINFCNHILSTTLQNYTEIPIYVKPIDEQKISLECVYKVLNEFKNSGWTVDICLRHFKKNFWGRDIECSVSEREYSIYTLIFR